MNSKFTPYNLDNLVGLPSLDGQIAPDLFQNPPLGG